MWETSFAFSLSLTISALLTNDRISPRIVHVCTCMHLTAFTAGSHTHHPKASLSLSVSLPRSQPVCLVIPPLPFPPAMRPRPLQRSQTCGTTASRPWRRAGRCGGRSFLPHPLPPPSTPSPPRPTGSSSTRLKSLQRWVAQLCTAQRRLLSLSLTSLLPLPRLTHFR